MSGAQLFILILFSIPIYGFLIYGCIDPEESYLLSKRWMFREEPELSEDAIYFHKRASMIAIVVITFMLVLIIYRSF